MKKLKDNFKTFPTTAPYSRDKLTFAHAYIDAILAWKRRIMKQLEDLLKEDGDPKIQAYTADMLLEELLGIKET